ncbi:hypothetical protein CALVIDRAFT_321895 [Calocera viscosa TUFC12733]|uniref:Secreted protein n=1 Tax=Calocera viscosa (strain TUFC12733) TaxID=1330018 RepID=A0A167QN98_CALVF|nr:hypothetical protein CALVIDRAFT_321895 [Calocera viscosa TUFC12733]
MHLFQALRLLHLRLLRLSLPGVASTVRGSSSASQSVNVYPGGCLTRRLGGSAHPCRRGSSTWRIRGWGWEICRRWSGRRRREGSSRL